MLFTESEKYIMNTNIFQMFQGGKYTHWLLIKFMDGLQMYIFNFIQVEFLGQCIAVLKKMNSYTCSWMIILRQFKEINE